MCIRDRLVGGQGKAAVAPIQVIVSGGEPNTANFIRGYSQGVIANWQQTRTPGGTIRKQPVDVAPRYWFNPAAKSRWYLVPGSITIVMTLIGTMLTACLLYTSLLAHEREKLREPLEHGPCPARIGIAHA